MRWIAHILCICCISTLATAPAFAADPRLDAALQCVKVSARLSRLACFDQVFDTPITEALTENDHLLRSDAWSRAINAETARSDQSGFLLNYKDPQNPKAGIWLTATAANLPEQPAQLRPILMLSCIDDISRVELVLPKPTSASRAAITVSGGYDISPLWVSDDSGSVIRTGRGLPAINTMKAMLSSSHVVLRSDLEGFKLLSFDAGNLNKAIAPMRKTCGW